jgi:YD repeat-containing protein
MTRRRTASNGRTAPNGRMTALTCALACAFMLSARGARAQESGANGVFFSTGDDGICVATSNVWYFEEFDGMSRPVSGTLWKSGTIAERTSWAYRDDGQQALKKTVTNETSSTTWEYDESGNVTLMRILDPKGNVVESIQNEYDSGGKITLTVRETGDEIVRTEIAWDGDEQANKKTFRNGQPVMLWTSTGKNDWTETMYHGGEAVLVVEYVDGVRKERR